MTQEIPNAPEGKVEIAVEKVGRMNLLFFGLYILPQKHQEIYVFFYFFFCATLTGSSYDKAKILWLQFTYKFSKPCSFFFIRNPS